MKIILTYALAIGFAGTSAMLVQRDMVARQGQSIDAQMAADGAYRDGVYLGKLARSAKSPMHPPIGRWSTEKDRASFAAGYRQGYNE
ncbi:MAG TPA: hypothetical protein VMQ17_06580 [Candidatus Sulfotelmatobacter sp.]|jgi:hypothetical protein|nr:hypothetical protein [Candidatus Sulfotelmatobacter sp.]